MNQPRDYELYWQQMRESFRYFPNTRYRVWLILDEVKRLSFGSVLEVGCGDASLLSALRENHPSATLAGCDVSHEIVDANRRYNAALGEFFQLDIADTQQAGALHRKFDLVICSEVIEHIEDYSLALRNLAQLVAPGGTLLVTTPTGRMWKTYKYHGHIRHFELDALIGEIAALGFSPHGGYRYGWPFVILQNWVAEIFFDQIRNSFIEVKSYGLGKRIISEVVYQLFKLNSRRAGPGLLIMMKKL